MRPQFVAFFCVFFLYALFVCLCEQHTHTHTLRWQNVSADEMGHERKIHRQNDCALYKYLCTLATFCVVYICCFFVVCSCGFDVIRKSVNRAKQAPKLSQRKIQTIYIYIWRNVKRVLDITPRANTKHSLTRSTGFLSGLLCAFRAVADWLAGGFARVWRIWEIESGFVSVYGCACVCV